MLSKTHTKYIQSLHHKKQRDETGLFIAEGPKVVMDLLNSRKFVCKEILALDSWLQQQTAAISKMKEATVTAITEAELQKISSLTTAHAVVAVFEKANQGHSFSTSSKITLALDTIQDPGNLGTIIRIADWFGIENLVCSPGCADMYNAKVVQSTMGSLGRVNVVYTDIVTWLAENPKTEIYAATLAGKDVKTVGRITEGIIIIGNEANGISEAVLDKVTQQITIPRIGKAESLNAAVAAGIILSHIK